MQPALYLHLIALTAIHPEHNMSKGESFSMICSYICWAGALLLFPTCAFPDATTPAQNAGQINPSFSRNCMKLPRPLHLQQLSFRGWPSDLRLPPNHVEMAAVVMVCQTKWQNSIALLLDFSIFELSCSPKRNDTHLPFHSTSNRQLRHFEPVRRCKNWKPQSPATLSLNIFQCLRTNLRWCITRCFLSGKHSKHPTIKSTCQDQINKGTTHKLHAIFCPFACFSFAICSSSFFNPWHECTINLHQGERLWKSSCQRLTLNACVSLAFLLWDIKALHHESAIVAWPRCWKPHQKTKNTGFLLTSWPHFASIQCCCMRPPFVFPPANQPRIPTRVHWTFRRSKRATRRWVCRQWPVSMIFKFGGWARYSNVCVAFLVSIHLFDLFICLSINQSPRLVYLCVFFQPSLLPTRIPKKMMLSCGTGRVLFALHLGVIFSIVVVALDDRVLGGAAADVGLGYMWIIRLRLHHCCCYCEWMSVMRLRLLLLLVLPWFLRLVNCCFCLCCYAVLASQPLLLVRFSTFLRRTSTANLGAERTSPPCALLRVEYCKRYIDELFANHWHDTLWKLVGPNWKLNSSTWAQVSTQTFLSNRVWCKVWEGNNLHVHSLGKHIGDHACPWKAMPRMQIAEKSVKWACACLFLSASALPHLQGETPTRCPLIPLPNHGKASLKGGARISNQPLSTEMWLH